MKIQYFIILVTSLLLTGCGSNKEEDIKTEADKETASNAKAQQQATILAPHLKTLNQAKGMSQTIEDAEAARKKEMDKQEDTTEDEEPN